MLNTAQLAVLNTDPADIVQARGNVFNALQFQGDTRSLIENAVGGSGNDHLVGNSAITGYPGAQAITR